MKVWKKRWKKSAAYVMAFALTMSAVPTHSWGGITVRADEEVAVLSGVEMVSTTLELLDVGTNLEPGTTYMDGMITIGGTADSTKSATLTYEEVNNTATDDAGTTYTYSAQLTGGNGTAKPAEGTGRYICITPTYTGSVTIAAKIGATKEFRVATITDGKVSEQVLYENTDSSSQKRVIKDIPVEAGTAYYFYSGGAGTDWYSFAYTYETEKTETPTNPDVEMVTVTEDVLEKLKSNSVSGSNLELNGMSVVLYGGLTYSSSGKVSDATDSEGNTYSFANGVINGGSGSADVTAGTGRFIAVTPKYDGMLQLAVKINNNSTKPFRITTLEGTTETVITEYTNTGTSSEYKVFKDISVEAGVTYYIYTKGAGTDWYNLALTYECEKEPEDPTPATNDIPAFPGVEGGGKYVTGGRGKTVYTVTNLDDVAASKSADCIEGSLRWALLKAKENGGGTIVFNVSGNIELQDTLEFKDISNVTIAGQTAPGDGITVSGYDTCLSNSNNIIIRYMRFRPGAINVHSGGDSMDALWGRDNNGFVIDHCSFSWNTDECLSIYRGQNGTVQWSLVYESLTLSGHSKGRHGYGAIAGGDNVTFHHNLYADHTSRNPRIGGGYGGAADASHVAVLQMSDNVIYNWGFNTAYGGGYAYTNYINNVEIAGPGTRASVQGWVINPGEVGKVGGFYIKGNYLANYLNRQNGEYTSLITMDNISQYGSFAGATSGSNATELASEPYYSADSTGSENGNTSEAFDEYLNQVLNESFDAEATLQEVLTKAGATYPRRDAIDARITAEVENGLGRYVNTEHEAGGFLSDSGVIVDEWEEGYDTDGDGMPDAWEDEHGLDKNDPADGSIVSTLSSTVLGTEGYTNLEVYLNSLVDMDHAAENPTAEITYPENNAMLQKGTDVTITVKAESENYSIVKAEFYYSTLTERTYIGEGTINGSTITCALPQLSDGSYFITARVYDSDGNATQTTAHEIHINTADTELTADGWTSVDIGDVDVAGYGNLENDVLTVKGNGKLGKAEGSVAGTAAADATTDAFHYVYKEITGDVEITAKLESISSVDNHAFAGIMVREDLEADAATAALGLSWAKTEETVGIPWAMYLTGRDKKGGAFDTLADSLDSLDSAAKAGVVLQTAVPFKDGPDELGYWMRLVRQGNEFTAYSSPDGITWTLMGSRTVEMDEAVYVGFAAESNRVANDMEQVNTARFSNITITSSIYPVTYDLENIEVSNKVDTVTNGNGIVVTLTTTKGYRLPDAVQVTIGDEEPVDIALELVDPLEGILTIENITGPVVISASPELDETGVEQVELIEIDDGGYLTVTTGSAITLTQTATDGRITKTVGSSLAKNVSYYVFPKTTDAQTMEMDVTILDRTDNESKDRGLFVGVFEIGNGEEEFSSLGFRNLSGSGEMGGMTAYFTKATGSSGNAGSSVNNGLYKNDQNSKPSYEIGQTYHVTFEKTGLGYKVTFTGTYAAAGSGVYPNGSSDGTDMDLYYVFSDKRPAETDEVQYGFALTGVTAQIENLTLTDSRGRIIYQQDAEATGVEELDDIELTIPADGLTKEEIAEELPAEVKVLFKELGSYQVKTAVWDIDGLEDVYTEAGTLEIQGSIEGFDDLTVTVTVVLQEGEAEEPTAPDETEEPSTPDDSEEPTTPDDSEEATTPDDSEEPTTPDDSEEASTPDDSEEPTTPDDSEEATTPDDSEEPTTPDDSEEASTPDDSEEPTTPDDSEEPTTPDEPDKPAKPSRPSYDEEEEDEDEEYTFESGLTYMEQSKVNSVLGSSTVVQEVVENSEGKLVVTAKQEIVFCENDGTLSKNEWQKVEDSWYYFGSDSKAVDGWLKSNDKWYYMNETDKKMETGWLKTNDGKWYLLDSVNGDMKTGWQFRGGKWYLLDDVNGDMKTDWQFKDGKWYLLDSVNGDMKLGWQLRGGKWYYLTATGAMAVNTTTPDGYKVDASGAWIQ